VCGGGRTKGCSCDPVEGLFFCRGDSPTEPELWTLLKASDNGFRTYRRAEDRRNLPDKQQSNPRRKVGKKPSGKPGGQTGGKPAPVAKHPPEYFAAMLKDACSVLRQEERPQFAELLALPVAVIEALPPGSLGAVGELRYNPAAPATRTVTQFCYAMYDGGGDICGLQKRLRDPVNGKNKFAVEGSTLGVFLPHGWQELPGAVHVVEGLGDALALHLLGIAAVGRPDADSCVDAVAATIDRLAPGRPVVVVGERDQKPGGKWPGRDGAKRFAERLATMLNRPTAWALPPESYKDARDYVSKSTAVGTPIESIRESFLQAVQLTYKATSYSPPPPDDGDILGGGQASPTRDGGSDNSDSADEGEQPEYAPDNPHLLARLYLASRLGQTEPLPRSEPPPIRYWRELFCEWTGTCYRVITDADVSGSITRWLQGHFERLALEERDEVKPITRAMVADVVCHIKAIGAIKGSIECPSWIDGSDGPNPQRLLAVSNGLLDIDAYAAGQADYLTPHTRTYFNMNAASFAFDEQAALPSQWLEFLSGNWPGDNDSSQLLQEWFGLNLVPDTSFQKIMLMDGVPRAGKGTIAHILKELVGKGNVCTPSLNDLAKPFGLQPLIGRSVAIVGDAMLSGRSDSTVIVERLKGISGEDDQTIDVKFKTPITTKLATRFTIIANELPRLRDASSAILSRFLVLQFNRSWLGKEDMGLKQRLETELPGILLWAVEGLRRLRSRGRFVQPQQGREALQELEESTSPVRHFIQERCVVDAAASVPVEDLYKAWCDHCERIGRKEPGDASYFGQQLRTSCRSVRKSRPRKGGERIHVYEGIRLREFYEEQQDLTPTYAPLPDVVTPGHPDHGLYALRDSSDTCTHIHDVHRIEQTMGGQGDRGDHLGPVGVDL
jgi:putative DNA primase/helicase